MLSVSLLSVGKIVFPEELANKELQKLFSMPILDVAGLKLSTRKWLKGRLGIEYFAETLWFKWWVINRARDCFDIYEDMENLIFYEFRLRRFYMKPIPWIPPYLDDEVMNLTLRMQFDDSCSVLDMLQLERSNHLISSIRDSQNRLMTRCPRKFRRGVRMGLCTDLLYPVNRAVVAELENTHNMFDRFT